MLTEFRIRNFKAWRDTGPIPLAPLNVIFGANSAGKSSLGQLLLALKQTALRTDRRCALDLGDADSLIDLGSFRDCLHGHDLAAKLEFTLCWRLDTPLEVRNSLDPGELYIGDELALSARLRAGPGGQPETESIEYHLRREDRVVLSAVHRRTGAGVVALEVSPLKLVQATGRKWPLEPPEKFYRFADVTLARYRNADFLARFALETERMLASLHYLGPLRGPPRRLYQWSGDAVPDVGTRGELAIPALLAATAAGRMLSRGPRRKREAFDRFIAGWLKELGLIERFAVAPIAPGRKEYEVLVRTHARAPAVPLTDVGFGLSQILPALVAAFHAPVGAMLWMEQPETHLHPRVQAGLADAFIGAIRACEGGAPRRIQLTVESHSEHFLRRLQRRIAEGAVEPEALAAYFCRRAGAATDLEPLRVNRFGDIENWPDGFFGDDMAEMAAHTQAAMRRRIAERKHSAR